MDEHGRNKIDRLTNRIKTESAYQWREWIPKIPYLKFPSNWGIQIIPPFGGAMARFCVKTGNDPHVRNVSVYLDCHEELGCCDEPYWEVYPYNGDTYRCGINETKKLIRAIEHSLKQIGHKRKK